MFSVEEEEDIPGEGGGTPARSQECSGHRAIQGGTGAQCTAEGPTAGEGNASLFPPRFFVN